MILESDFDEELRNSVKAGTERMKEILKIVEDYKNKNDQIKVLKKTLIDLTPDNMKNVKLDPGVSLRFVEINTKNSSMPIKVNIYSPNSEYKNLPCIYHIHGGGMIVGSVEYGKLEMSKLVKDFGIVVVDVEYRLAPEYPYPNGINDCYDGLQWVADHADDLGIDANRIGLMGESAGGGLAASLALMARDRGGPKLIFQCLIAPMLNDRNNTESSLMCSGPWPSWPRELNELGWYALLGEIAGKDGVSYYASASRASNLSNLPEAYVEVGGQEVFRDEDIDYAHMLMKHGIPVEIHVYPGAYHSWYGVVPDAKVSKMALLNRTEWMKRRLKLKTIEQ